MRKPGESEYAWWTRIIEEAERGGGEVTTS